jgi:hypothetical protein
MRRQIRPPRQHAAIQRKTGGRQGTFVLQGSEIVENGKITARWFVVPGSGTGDLSGLRGEGGFEGDSEKGPMERWIIGSNDAATIVDGITEYGNYGDSAFNSGQN